MPTTLLYGSFEPRLMQVAAYRRQPCQQHVGLRVHLRTIGKCLIAPSMLGSRTFVAFPHASLTARLTVALCVHILLLCHHVL